MKWSLGISLYLALFFALYLFPFDFAWPSSEAASGSNGTDSQLLGIAGHFLVFLAPGILIGARNHELITSVKVRACPGLSLPRTRSGDPGIRGSGDPGSLRRSKLCLSVLRKISGSPSLS